MKHCTVTGANGFLGANVGAFLDGRATRVGAVRRDAAPDALFDRYVASDLEDPVDLVRAIEEEYPGLDLVISVSTDTGRRIAAGRTSGRKRVAAPWPFPQSTSPGRSPLASTAATGRKPPAGTPQHHQAKKVR